MKYSFIRLLCVLLLAGIPTPLSMGQSASPRNPPHLSTQFYPLDLPAPSVYRSASGEPGPAYWQQRADYHIQATLDADTHQVTGTETITYTNNAPQSLKYLWVQLDQNLFRPDSRGATLQAPLSRWRGSFEEGGFDISRVEIVQNGEHREASYLIDDTRMRIALDEPMPPNGSQIDIIVDFAFNVPEYGADRMGRLSVKHGVVYEVAQWHPRMYVYDDIRGWDPLPYLGQGEFYLEYGTFNVELTVPREFIVMGPGDLLNPDEVLTADQRSRLERARHSDETVVIIGQDEVGKPEARPTGNGPLTWKFRAENVRDFAWAASQAFIWDAASWESVLIMSAYPEEGLGASLSSNAPGWEMSTQFARHTIQHYSEQWHQYPYPVAINVAGIVGGMEYPQIVFCSVRARGTSLFGVTDHEFGHSWFPMIVGSNERRHAWMDEGFDTFINYYSGIAYYGDDAARNSDLASDFIAGLMRSPVANQPIETAPDYIGDNGLGFLVYRKPAKGLVMLREVVLGPERFDSALRAYIARWAFKHPQPADFFRTMNDVAGEDLDWFWNGWFNTTHTLDQAIQGVAIRGKQTMIMVANRGELVMPVALHITRANGAHEQYEIPVEAWSRGEVFELLVPGNNVAGVTIDQDGLLPDTDRTNNTWRLDKDPTSTVEPTQP